MFNIFTAVAITVIVSIVLNILAMVKKKTVFIKVNILLFLIGAFVLGQLGGPRFLYLLGFPFFLFMDFTILQLLVDDDKFPGTKIFILGLVIYTVGAIIMINYVPPEIYEPRLTPDGEEIWRLDPMYFTALGSVLIAFVAKFLAFLSLGKLAHNVGKMIGGVLFPIFGTYTAFGQWEKAARVPKADTEYQSKFDKQ